MKSKNPTIHVLKDGEEVIKCEVPRLIVDQDMAIIKIMKQAGIFSFDELEIDDMIARICENELVHEFLATVLVPVNECFDKKQVEKLKPLVGKLHNEEVEAVFRDFLSVNKKFIDRLKNIFHSGTAIKVMAMQAMGKMKASSTSPAAETSPNVN